MIKELSIIGDCNDMRMPREVRYAMILKINEIIQVVNDLEKEQENRDTWEMEQRERG